MPRFFRDSPRRRSTALRTSKYPAKLVHEKEASGKAEGAGLGGQALAAVLIRHTD